jgi:RNA polymerase sigma-70 factor (ECF subfamily)
MVGERERALELAQEVLLNAWRNLESFGGRSAFGSWLFVIARNRCLTELRRPPLLHDEETDPDSLASGETAHDLRFEREQDEDRLLDLVRSCLDPTEQEAIWLRCYEGMPVDEITRVLRVTENTGARAVLQRARRKLRLALEARSAGSGGGS